MLKSRVFGSSLCHLSEFMVMVTVFGLVAQWPRETFNKLICSFLSNSRAFLTKTSTTENHFQIGNIRIVLSLPHSQFNRLQAAKEKNARNICAFGLAAMP